jgi:peptidoglycan/xylan/chitin deacetylase (PgdA/CDA1 family)
MPVRLLFLVCLALIASLLVPFAHAADRYVALTIDDLPYQRGKSLAEVQALTTSLVNQIKGIPTVGFVNESKLHEGGEQELAARTALLEQWLAAGAELGNHMYSHPDINVTPIEEYERDLLRGEEITRPLMRQHGMTLRYFRHPYLRAGKEAHIKAELERFLREHDYTIAPVTIDNDEWVFAFAYDKAAEQNDRATMKRIAEDYLSYMEQCFAFSEHLATQVLGRNVKQVLLIHANAMNAEYLDELISMIKKRGYAFIPLAEALDDEAYRREDPYVGPKGWSWLLRWGMNKPLDTSRAPQVPAYINELAGIE